MKGQKKNTAAMVYDLAKPITDEAGVYLWDVRFEKEGASWFLKVIIDSDDGITFDDCEAVSRPFSGLLDEEDLIEQSYYLEVSSPGVMRELRKPDHFEVCIGDDVVVKLIRPDENGQPGIPRQPAPVMTTDSFAIEAGGRRSSIPPAGLRVCKAG